MSEIKFSNLIFEQQKEVIAQTFTNPKFDINAKPISNTNPNPTLDYSSNINLFKAKDKEYYINKINTPGVNLDLLKQDLLTQPLLDLVKTNLLDMIKKKQASPDQKVEYKDYFFELDPKTKSGFGVSGSGTGSGTSSPSQDQTLFLDPDSGVELDPFIRSKMNLESLYSGGIEKDPVIKTRGMKPSTESIGMEQAQTLASLQAQYNETKKKINLLDKLYTQIVRNPTNLNLGSLLNAHTGAQFVKLAEKDIIEADEVTEEYYDDLLPGFGTALEHPEKYRNIPTDEIKPHKAPKFIKVK